ncbi:MAG: TonB-dependent receptor [Acidobacteriota bacterium]|nr:TonB-dependent receptor [Acidobacteriota bacterium]
MTRDIVTRCRVAAAVLALVVSTQFSLAQTPPPVPQSPAPVATSITGKVLNQNGEPVHGAQIVVIGIARTVTTADDGTYTLPNVAPGSYEVIAQREHLTTERQSVTVTAGQAATADFTLSIEGVHEEVVVTASATGQTTTFESFNSIASLDTVEIAKRMGATLAEVLEGQGGVAKRSFGPGNTRPIIRGFDGDRVLIMQDGVRTGDLSSQSGDHGTSIDPASLQRLEVVKGPATLLYGSNALGGVVNAISPQESFRTAPFKGVLGGLTFDGGTANEQAGANGSVQYGTGPWLFWGNAGARRTDDYDTPAGTVANSGTRLANGGGGLGWNGTRGFFGAGVKVERSRFGVPFAGSFEGGEADIDLESRRTEIRVDGGLRNLANGFVESAKVVMSVLDYQHKELEVEDGTETIGTTFNNNVLTVRAELQQKPRGRLSGQVGAEAFFRDYEAIGEEALAPATRQSSVAGFVYEEADFGKARLQFGLRVERNAYDVDPRPGFEEEPEVCIAIVGGCPPPTRNRDFTGVSGSFGVHVDVTRGAALVANVSRASRAPALEELYNFGPHIGNLAFEIGNPRLETETSLGFDVSLRGRGSKGRGEVNVYTYDISNFVFLDVTGAVLEGLRVAPYQQGDSRFTGVDASAHLQLAPWLHVNAGLGYVRATLNDTGEHLPRIPPFQGRLELEIPWRHLTLAPEVVFTADQNRVFRDETSTRGSARFNLGATYIVGQQHLTHIVAVEAYNLTNEPYRLHTSFIKNLALEMGRGIKATYSVKFF